MLVFLMLLLVVSYFLPWWSAGALCFAMGLLGRGSNLGRARVAGLGAVVWLSLACVQDVANHGLIADRVSGLFHLPWAWLVYALMAALGALCAFLGLQAGICCRFLFENYSQRRA